MFIAVRVRSVVENNLIRYQLCLIASSNNRLHTPYITNKALLCSAIADLSHTPLLGPRKLFARILQVLHIKTKLIITSIKEQRHYFRRDLWLLNK